MSDEFVGQMQQLQTCDDEEEEAVKVDRSITLFVKAGSDHECVGCCPFSQRLFMILWLKGVVFNVTTVDKVREEQQIKDLAPGAKPPFVMFRGELLTDIPKCVEFIDTELYPPKHPKLACKYPKSNTIGEDIFAKFSALIKNTNPSKKEAVEKRLLDQLSKLNNYLNEPLDHEIDPDDDDDQPKQSTRKFIDGDYMTLADCNMLPKLNIIQVAGKYKVGFTIPEEFTGIHRYLNAAREMTEFTGSCPADEEIIWTYGGPKPRIVVKH